MKNINSQFSNSLPELTAFRTFDPLGLPEKSGESFNVYGTADIKILVGHFYRCVDVASSMFEVVSSLWSNQNAGLSEQQRGYLFHTNAVIPHKTSQQAHARLVSYASTSVTFV